MVPQDIQGFRWTVEPLGIRAMTTPERLVPVGGASEGPPALFITRLHPFIGRRSHYEFHAFFRADLPEGGQLEIPVRAKAESDDLPDDMPEPFIDAILTVTHQPPSP